MKVVCVKNPIMTLANTNVPTEAIVFKGEIYTVIYTIMNGGKDYYKLKEKPLYFYCSDGFRPIQDIGDQVEEHINELLKKDLEIVKA